MKLGICAGTLIGQTREELTFKMMAKLAKDTGFEGVELAFGHNENIPTEISEQEARTILDDFNSLDVAITSLMGIHLLSHPFTVDESDQRKQSMDYTKKLIQVAHWMNLEHILVLSGVVGPSENSKTVPYYEDVYKRSVEAMQELAEFAEPLGVTLCVENVWNKFLLSPLEMRRYIDEIDMDNVKVYFDTGNVILFGYPEHWIRALGDRIACVHIKDYKNNVGLWEGFCDPPAGDVNWPLVMKELHTIDYDGFLTCELPGRSFEDLKKLSETMRQILTM